MRFRDLEGVQSCLPPKGNARTDLAGPVWHRSFLREVSRGGSNRRQTEYPLGGHRPPRAGPALGACAWLLGIWTGIRRRMR